MVLRSSEDDGSVRDRLIRAADTEIAVHGFGAVKMEAVARRAGVSRATAFRQLGTVYELMVQVALSHAKRHEIAVQAVMAATTGALTRIESALIYTTRELPTDPSVSALIARHTSSSHHPHVHAAAMRVMKPVLVEGQRDREIREDVEIDEMIDFIVEQTYLLAEAEDRSEDAVRRRFRHFIAPGLAPQRGPSTSTPAEPDLKIAVQAALEAVEDLAHKLREQN